MARKLLSREKLIRKRPIVKAGFFIGYSSHRRYFHDLIGFTCKYLRMCKYGFYDLKIRSYKQPGIDHLEQPLEKPGTDHLEQPLEKPSTAALELGIAHLDKPGFAVMEHKKKKTKIINTVVLIKKTK